MGKINENRKSSQEIFHKSDDHPLNINLCVKFDKPLLFTGIQRVKAGFVLETYES